MRREDTHLDPPIQEEKRSEGPIKEIRVIADEFAEGEMNFEGSNPAMRAATIIFSSISSTYNISLLNRDI